MQRMNNIKILGVLFIFLFLSFSPSLIDIPTKITPGISALAKQAVDTPVWIKEMTGYADKSKREIELELLHSLRIAYFQNLLFTSVGILCGILLLLRKKTGKYFTLAISVSALVMWLNNHMSSGNIWERLHAKFTIIFPEYPLEIIHRDVVANIIYLSAIVLLLLPSTAQEFMTEHEKKTAT